MAISLTACILLLKEHHLLKSSAIQSEDAQTMTGISYDSRKVEGPTLFFCKGTKFRPIYLSMARDKGATTYVAEKPYVEGNGLNALIVTNITKAMSILGAAFYDFPQDDLHVIAFTGTKGKTTSAYFTRGILEAAHPKHVALFSTIDRIVGPDPDQRFKSDLTTPESLDLFHDMREAVDNGMTHLVMEVSSQAYLRNRVFGLTYDVGFFLNISPDHIGPNEHPTFANYLHNKLQLLVNSRKVVINAETDHFDEVYAAARTTTYDDSIYLFASAGFQPEDPTLPIDFRFDSSEADLETSKFTLIPVTDKAVELNIGGSYSLSLIGDYNESNATAAIIGAGLAGVDATTAAAGIKNVQIPGRMEATNVAGHGHVYVDYAHNYASMKALLSFLNAEYNNPNIRVVIGAPGDKGVSRRADFAKVLNEYADEAYLTTDDPGFESADAIADQIREGIDEDRVQVKKIIDRREAIKTAIEDSRPEDIVVVAGKGADPYQKVRGVDTPWPKDMVVVKEIAKELAE
ncbi:UDP-N-acetylmuramoyl-L-alanyl-D-glutamate--2,6-diaminopimelate ligase [Lacticaseibacillus pabuli]|uniref:UDP-N-acetylmuramyl-tripeptide synthetase n=1 Tax=Lacticaseibacillus pabuli TaxID=3025672 RepID=A0ABY7WU77_9LACO|nr:UDP-N-acetylmuramoyl-L-alanyl-D-glutamate--2,6-diaminopimelate ligase [Lacticaseibacillus sp. KACC 23028]WDF82551.1 UDP-N-acetylmuramoyl-L-alanyl-D-glutamate--2,6-diaminopimelate ligase [Lacticaseibacillus sp. KACC 23028]